MNHSPKKCKEMLYIMPTKNIPDVTPLMVNETILERVSVYKALGVIIKDNLRWNDNIDKLVQSIQTSTYS